MIGRRAVLAAGGAAAVVVLGSTWALTRAPRRARAPWRAAAEGFGDPRLDVLAFAILAPSAHNMQPWRISLEGDDSLRVFVDPSRLLPEGDPLGRQTTIGFGCFLEMCRLAATAKGYRADITPFPDGAAERLSEERAIAAVRLTKDAAAPVDPLFEWALQRRTSRAPFDATRPVADEDLEGLVGASVPGVAAAASRDPALVADLRALTTEAWNTEWRHAPTRRESLAVTRIGKAAIEDAPWGLSLMGPMIEGLNAAGMLTREAMDQPDSTAFEQSRAFYANACQTAAAFVWTVTADNTRVTQLEAGRAWVRLHLEATRRGLGFHPLSQALQEFPAMAPHYRRAHALLAPDGGVVQMLTRVGYAAPPPPAPREPLEAKLSPV